MGYGNLTIRRDFPELQSSEDDKIWVVFRNPKVVPQAEISAIYAKGGAGGKIVGAAIKAAAASDTEAGTAPAGTDAIAAEVMDSLTDDDMDELFSSSDRLISHLVIASRIYDPTVLPEFDENGEQAGDYEPKLLPSKLRPEDAAKLPGPVKDAFNEAFRSANPQQTPASGEVTGNQS